MSTPTVIAEAGVNHNGDPIRAREMVHVAAEAGADFVKFQAFRAAEIAASRSPTAVYQRARTGENDQSAMLRGLELSLDDFADLAAECRKAKIRFLCTPFGPSLASELVGLGMACIKVASGEITNLPALERFAAFRLPVILSTGMATLAEVGAALEVLNAGGASDVTLLHCTSLYPAPYATVNLRAMVAMATHFGRPVGYSDHTLGDHVAVAAVALGASVIEKHFTLDRALPGPDHAASLEPGELAALVRRVRETAEALGDGRKVPQPGEEAMARLVRRSWHAARRLPAGRVLVAEDVVLKRPADGLPPAASPVGRQLAAPRETDDPIRSGDLA